VTYPSHTTIVTGVSPARHGILANRPFDPVAPNPGPFWYAEDIKAKTLWDAAAEAGLTTASVDWPVTAGARIRWNIAQIARAGTADEGKLAHAVSTAGLLAEAERVVGPWPAGDSGWVEVDRQKAAFDLYLLRTRKPHLQLCYFSGLDEEQHATGPGSPEAMAALEEIDRLVGRIRSAAERRGGGAAYIAVVSDHGFARSDRYLDLGEPLRRAGLFRLDAQGRVASWRAFGWNAAGSTAVMLHDPADEEARRKVAAVLDRLAADSANGIGRILTGAQARAEGGFPDAAFVVGARPGFSAVPASAPLHGEHGYLPEDPEMDASFLLAGPGLPAGRDLGRIDMRDVAPTLAGLLHVSLPEAEGRDLLD
jgi:predicted AlkP superfamily pyrophosphatase or phosphodiesterase